jgi:nucleoside-diphosphate-sugar epimerase
MLVRARTPDEGVARTRSSARKFGVAEPLLARIGVEHVLCGDFTDPGSYADDARIERATCVINCAALATFAENPRLWPVNVDGTVAFAQRMSQSPALRRFLHVGTAMSCGPGLSAPIIESWAFPPRDAHLVTYTASKAEVERRMREELPGLPLVVARPSIIVGHTELGCAPSGSIFWVFRMAQALERFTCSLDERIDVVPVDYCADALAHLARRPRLAHDLYHVSSGSSRSCTFGEIDAALARARDGQPMGSRYRRVTEDALVSVAEDLHALFGPCNRRLVVRALTLYGGFAELNYVFDNDRLLGEGVPPPPRFADYAGVCAKTSEHIKIADQMHWDFK